MSSSGLSRVWQRPSKLPEPSSFWSSCWGRVRVNEEVSLEVSQALEKAAEVTKNTEKQLQAHFWGCPCWTAPLPESAVVLGSSSRSS